MSDTDQKGMPPTREEIEAITAACPKHMGLLENAWCAQITELVAQRAVELFSKYEIIHLGRCKSWELPAGGRDCTCGLNSDLARWTALAEGKERR